MLHDVESNIVRLRRPVHPIRHIGPRTRQIHYAMCHAAADRIMQMIWGVAELMPIGRDREHLTALAHLYGARADLYTAMEVGDARGARAELRRWRVLRRAVYGPQAAAMERGA